MASRLLPGTIRRKVSVKTLPVSIPKSKLLAPDSSGLITDGVSRLTLRSVAVLSRLPANPVDLDQAIELDWFNDDTDGLALGSYGHFNRILSESTSRLVLGSYGEFIESVGLSSNISRLALGSYSEFYVGFSKTNWVKWSDIGNLDFTINKSNVAGERPLDWKGDIYSIKKLGNKVIAYGENGVSLLTPIGNTYGLNTIYKLGLKGKQAIAGDDTAHFFIDIEGKLWKLGEVLELLDYSEYLSTLNNPVISIDIENSLLYICDGTIGFIYNYRYNSLGVGPINVTDISSQSGNLYVVAPATITTPIFGICTDIYDFGNRKNKIIRSIEVGTNLTIDLYGLVDYRINEKVNFRSTGWVRVNPSGITNIPCFGIEFRFKLKTITYEYFELDYMKINGSIYGYSYIDSLQGGAN